tara:strand:- start:3377 stop:4537 length:1161 start_codon:yes stop_codon:yes gene_type:complete
MNTDVLQNVLGQHFARRIPFDELYSGLIERTELDVPTILRGVLDDLEIFFYSRDTTYERSWDEFTMISRGLILCPFQKMVVATPFTKFFNFGEITHWVPTDEKFSTIEKVDGSLGIIFHHNGDWRVSTKGSLESDQGIWATEWLRNNVDLDILTPGWTYLSEIVYEANRIVVPYDWEGLALLGAMDNNGYEEDVSHLADDLGMVNPKKITFNSVDDVIAYCKPLPYTTEGFVLRFDNGYRVKIKGDDYLEKHKEAFSFGPLRVWERLRECVDLEDSKQALPEEFWDDFDKYVEYFNRKFCEVCDLVSQTTIDCKDLSDKEVGLKLKTLDPISRKFIFPARKKNLLLEVYHASPSRDMVFDLFRPAGNVLDKGLMQDDNELSEPVLL